MNLSKLPLEPFDIAQIKTKITSGNQLCLTRLDIFRTINSTNTYLLEQAHQQPVSGWVCLAEEQTAGRGRQGRVWHSPPGGNIYCSILWQFTPSTDISALSLCMGVAVAKTLAKYGIDKGISLKWPNDILYLGRKLSGILLERTGEFVVIGMGINLNLEGANPEWIDLLEITNQPIARNHLVGILINELLTTLALFEKQGVSPFLKDWRERDYLFETSVRLHLPDHHIDGIMLGINQNGELLLKTDKNVILSFRSGEISVRPHSLP